MMANANQDEYADSQENNNTPYTPGSSGTLEPVVVTPMQPLPAGPAQPANVWPWLIGFGVLAMVLAGRK